MMIIVSYLLTVDFLYLNFSFLCELKLHLYLVESFKLTEHESII